MNRYLVLRQIDNELDDIRRLAEKLNGPDEARPDWYYDLVSVQSAVNKELGEVCGC